MKRNFLVYIVFLSLVMAPLRVSADANNPQPAPPAAIAINPESLRHQLLENNLSLLQTMNQVHDARDTVNIARGNLLPSINLGMVLQQTGASFLISTVQFLLPFLMPSSWFNLSAAKEQFEAEKLSYKILELNTYSAALSLYFTVQNDMQLQRIYQQEYDDLNKIYQILKKENDLLGLSSPEDVEHARAQASLALEQVQGISGLVTKEVASLRRALGLPLTTTITIDSYSMAPSDWESKPLQDVIAQANAISPEHDQIDYVVKAAESQEWSAVFGFISGMSIFGQVSGNQQSTIFSNLVGKGNINLGFAYFPSVTLAQRNIEEIKLRKTQVEQENAEILESTLGSLQNVQSQISLAAQAEASLHNVYQAELKKYNLGIGSMTSVLLARAQITQSSTIKLKDEMNLSILRSLLHRSMLSDQFALIKGCGAKQPEKKDDTCGGFFGWLGCLFGGSEEDHPSLDQVCREGSVNYSSWRSR